MENITEYENSRLSVNSAVAEITTIISQHLTKVFDQVANENDDISQNLKILNQLSFVVELRKENQDLKQQLNIINTKYKSCLEELIMIKSQAKVTMEITELDSIHNTSIPSQADIESTIKNTQYKSLWDIHGLDDDSEHNESDDSDAQTLSLSYGLNFSNINKLDSESSLKLKELREDPKNKDMSAEEIKIAIDRWKLFYKDNIIVNCNKSEEDTINDIMDSSAGLKGWSESSYELITQQTDGDDEEDEDEDDSDDEESDDEESDDEENEDEDEEDEDEDEEDEDEEDEDEDEDEDEEEKTNEEQNNCKGNGECFKQTGYKAEDGS